MHGVQSLQGPHRNTSVQGTTQQTQGNHGLQDEVRFSDEAMKLSESKSGEESSVAGVRFDLVNRIKAEIAAGTYETADKMDIALDRMFGQLSPR